MIAAPTMVRFRSLAPGDSPSASQSQHRTANATAQANARMPVRAIRMAMVDPKGPFRLILCTGTCQVW